MGARGPAKRPDAIRRNLPPKQTVLDVPTPLDRPLPGNWSDGTLAWWTTWVRSPQSTQFAETDWKRLEFLAHLVERYLTDPQERTLAEIRLNEERLGATVSDRKRLQWELPRPDDGKDRQQVSKRGPIRIVDHYAASGGQ